MARRVSAQAIGATIAVVFTVGLSGLVSAVQTGGLKIVVIEGEAAVNIIQQKTAIVPVVEVRDQNDLPVAGAVVTFAIRSGRASFNGARTLTITTNATGRAAAAGLTPTGTGSLQISATAAFNGQTAVATIAQTNAASAAAAGTGGAAAGGGGGGLSAATIGVIGAAAAGGTVAVAKATNRDSAPESAAVVTESFSGVTDVRPAISFAASPAQPPVTIRVLESVTFQVTFSSPPDCALQFRVCRAAAFLFSDCPGGKDVTGVAGSITWATTLSPDIYSVLVGLATSPRSDNGPICQAFTGTIRFSGTATHH